MTKGKIAEVLKKHIAWLKGETGGERANLCGADLHGADLCGANLHGANLCGADLCGADLHGADLCGANLCEANLHGANLCGANLHGANLHGANLREANLPPELVTKFFPLACPEYGEFIGWKKCNGNLIVKLLIPEDARRSSAFGRKCRCDKAVVLGIEDIDGNPAECEYVTSSYDSSFIYHVGDIVSVDNFDTNRTHECAPGIHFFITRQEAVDY